MHTEEEAKKLWCPHARHVIDTSDPVAGAQNGYPTSNRFGGTHYDDECRCIASRCSQWRWLQSQNRELQALDKKPEFEGMYGPWKKNLFAFGWVSEEDPTHGYCGLAGCP